MIQKESILKVVDNSGCNLVKCFCIYGGSFVKKASVGDVILVSVKTVTARKLVNTKIKKCIVTSQKKWKRRDNGHYIKSDRNSVIVLQDIDTLGSSYITGPLFSEVFFNGKIKASSLVKDII